MSRARSVANLGNQSLNLGISDGGLTIGTGVTIENTGKSQFAGIVTASQFVGDGSGLTGVTGTGSGVVIQEEGTNVGTAATINFVGSAVTAAISGGVATVEISSSGGGGGDTVSINATATDILSVSSGSISADDAGADKLVFWDDSAGKLTYLTVGSNLTVTNSTIAASGGGGGSGISNVVEDTTPQLGGNLDLNSKDITGTGNANITGVVTATTFSGSGASLTSIPAGQLTGTVADARLTTVSSSKLSGALPALDGSALTGVTATGSGVVIKHDDSVVGTAATINFGTNLDVSALSAGIVTVTSSGSSGISNIVEDTTPQLGGNLDLNSKDITGTGNANLTGVITATSFSGDGSALTGVTASGSIGIQSAGTLVGTATTINFGSGATITNNVASVSVGSTTRFVGARMYHNDYSVTASGSWTSVENYDGVTLDTNSFTNATNGRFTIPAGVSKIKLSTNVRVVANGNTNNQWMISKNGTLLDPTAGGFNIDIDGTSGYNNPGAFGQTAIIDVVEGDYFNLAYYVSNTNLDIDAWYQIEVVEGDILGTYFSANNIVDDTTPQLGGNLDLNSKDITGTGNVNLTGVITATSASFTGNVSIAGTLTYEDVTNIDSIGIVTARTGIKVLAGGADISGVVTATTFSGSGASLTSIPAGQLTGTVADARLTTVSSSKLSGALPAISGANLTNLPAPTPADTDVQVTYDISDNSNNYRITGPGYDASENNPDLYLVRGQRYRFINGTGSSHPFRIQSDTSGTAYTDGVSGSQSGTQDFNVQNDAPSRLYYQCTIHGGMIGNIYITGGADWRMTDVATSATPEIFTNLNVGIGTDNPQYKLHVTGGAIDLNSSSTAFGDGVRVGKNIIGYSGQKLNISSQSNGIYLEGTSTSVIDLTSSGIIFGNSPSGEIEFYPNTWTINNNPTITGTVNFASNIGIGTDNPVAKLEVVDSSSLGIISRSEYTQSTDTNKALKVRNNSTTDTFNVSYKGQGYFAGKVGIGSDNPGATLDLQSTDTEILLRLHTLATKNAYLDIVSDANRRGIIRFQDTDGTYRWSMGKGDSDELTNTSFFINAGNNGGNSAKFVITSDGKIGIGTDSPATMLEVGNQSKTLAGAITVSNGEIIGGGTGPIITLKHGPAGGTQRTHQIYSYIGDLRIVADSNENMEFHTGGGESLRITSDGQLQATGAADVRLTLGSSGTAGTNDSVHVRADSANLKFMAANSGDTIFEANGTETLRITSAGLVGINNSNPLHAMHFKNAMASSPSFIHMEATGNNIVGGGGGIAFDTSASNAQSNNTLYLATIKGIRNSSDDGSNDLVFSTTKAGVTGDDGNAHSPKEKLRITSDGNMGLGTTSPNSYNNYHTLTINGTTGGEVDFEVNSTLTADIFANAGGLFLNTRTSAPIIFSTYNGSSFGERLRIKADGNVGIGLTNPSHKLHVNGGVRGDYIETDGHAVWTQSVSTGTGGESGGVILKTNPDQTNSNLSGAFIYRVRAVVTGTGTDTGAMWLVYYKESSAAYQVRYISRSGTSSNHPRLRIANSNQMELYTTHSSNYVVRVVTERFYTEEPDSTLHAMGSDYHWQRDNDTLTYSDGYISKPNQPAFNAAGFPSHRYLNTWQGVDLSSWNTVVQNGSHFNNSNGKFTAPIGGKYFFTFTTMFHNPDTADFAIRLEKNGTMMVISNNHSGGGNSNGHQWNDATISAVIELAANDYVTATASGSSSSTCYMYGSSNSKYGSFCGFLIG